MLFTAVVNTKKFSALRLSRFEKLKSNH